MVDVITVTIKDKPMCDIPVKNIAYLSPYPGCCDIGLKNGQVVHAVNSFTDKSKIIKNIRELLDKPFISHY